MEGCASNEAVAGAGDSVGKVRVGKRDEAEQGKRRGTSEAVGFAVNSVGILGVSIAPWDRDADAGQAHGVGSNVRVDHLDGKEECPVVGDRGNVDLGTLWTEEDGIAPGGDGGDEAWEDQA